MASGNVVFVKCYRTYIVQLITMLQERSKAFCDFCHTWKTLGALTSEVKADERVAENIPAVIKGANPETMLITFREKNTREP